MSDLTEFLLARIGEDEASAPGHNLWCSSTDPCHEPPYEAGPDESLCDCRRRRAMAECEAKRRIIEWHQNWPVLAQTPPVVETTEDGLGGLSARMSQRLAWLTTQEYVARFGEDPPTGPMLLALALPYADHPDFQDEWRA